MAHFPLSINKRKNILVKGTELSIIATKAFSVKILNNDIDWKIISAFIYEVNTLNDLCYMYLNVCPNSGLYGLPDDEILIIKERRKKILKRMVSLLFECSMHKLIKNNNKTQL